MSNSKFDNAAEFLADLIPGMTLEYTEDHEGEALYVFSFPERKVFGEFDFKGNFIPFKTSLIVSCLQARVMDGELSIVLDPGEDEDFLSVICVPDLSDLSQVSALVALEDIFKKR